MRLLAPVFPGVSRGDLAEDPDLGHAGIQDRSGPHRTGKVARLGLEHTELRQGEIRLGIPVGQRSDHLQSDEDRVPCGLAILGLELGFRHGFHDVDPSKGRAENIHVVGRMRHADTSVSPFVIAETCLGIGKSPEDLHLPGSMIESGFRRELEEPGHGLGCERTIAGRDGIGYNPECIVLKVSAKSLGDQRQHLVRPEGRGRGRGEPSRSPWP